MNHPNRQIVIRPGREDDWEAMRRTFAEAGQAGWREILPDSPLADLSAPERWRPGGAIDVLVAESDGQIAGFICLRRSGDEDAGAQVGEIDSFYTHPSVWGTGDGRALLSAAVARLAAAGVHRRDALDGAAQLPAAAHLSRGRVGARWYRAPPHLSRHRTRRAALPQIAQVTVLRPTPHAPIYCRQVTPRSAVTYVRPSAVMTVAVLSSTA